MKSKIIFIIFLNAALLFSQNGVNRRIAVTIDDLPVQNIKYLDNKKSHELTDKLLAKIKSQNAPVTGFVNEEKLQDDGNNDESKIELLEKWLDAGLDLGNHTFSHKSANKVPIDEFKKDILDGERVIRKLIDDKGKKLKYFRYPFLQTGRNLEVKNGIEKFLEEHNYTVAPVTFDNAEWIFATAYRKATDSSKTEMMNHIGEEYISYMKQKLDYWESQSAALFGRNINHILLIHANSLNADYFDRLCEMIRSSGYFFIPLDEALTDEAFKFTGGL